MVRWSIAVFVCAFVFAATAAAQRPAISTVKDVMLVLTIPGSEAAFNAAAEPPTKEAEWTTLRKKAAPLVEGADMMLTPKYSVDSEEWRQYARAHRTAVTKTMAAIEKKDATALSDASDALYETCETCHKRFLK